MRPFNLKEYKEGDAVQTRDGKPVRILCTDAPDVYCVIGLVADEHIPRTWTAHGFFAGAGNAPRREDLFFAPKVTKLWVNVYKHGGGIYTTGANLFSSEAGAKQAGGKAKYYLRAYEITIEE